MEIIPMSHIDSILGLPGLAIERVDRQLGVMSGPSPQADPLVIIVQVHRYVLRRLTAER